MHLAETFESYHNVICGTYFLLMFIYPLLMLDFDIVWLAYGY